MERWILKYWDVEMPGGWDVGMLQVLGCWDVRMLELLILLIMGCLSFSDAGMLGS